MRKKSNEGVGNLTVEVYDGNSVVKVHNAIVKITGHYKPPGHFKKPVSFSANTRLHGFVKFTDIPLDMYKVEVSRKWYEPTIIQNVSAKIPGKDPVGHFAKPHNLAKIKFPRIAPWMKNAMNEIGQKEIPGQKNNPRVMEYHKAAGSYSTGDSGKYDAWCAGFVSWIMKQHGCTPPKKAMRALSWKDFGKAVKNPIFGAIGIKERRGGGHVSFVVGQSRDRKFLYMLGGNQNNEVNISQYKKSTWLKFVIPSNYYDNYGILPVYQGRFVVADSEA
jgi:uncharacterized protein (TIGR02594 family)